MARSLHVYFHKQQITDGHTLMETNNVNLLTWYLIKGKVYQYELKVPYLLSTISPKAVFALAEVQVYTTLRIHICSAGPGPKGFQSTEGEVKFDLAELGHSGIDGWCLEYEGFPLRRNIKYSSVAQSHY